MMTFPYFFTILSISPEASVHMQDNHFFYVGHQGIEIKRDTASRLVTDLMEEKAGRQAHQTRPELMLWLEKTRFHQNFYLVKKMRRAASLKLG